MQQTDAQQLLVTIIEYAQNGQITEFQFIKTWQEFRFYSRKARSTKLIISTLAEAANNLFKDYCKTIATGSQDVTQLLAYRELRHIINFYERDLEVLNRMVDDYDTYLGQGNFWHSFLGGERKYYFQKDENIWNIH